MLRARYNTQGRKLTCRTAACAVAADLNTTASNSTLPSGSLNVPNITGPSLNISKADGADLNKASLYSGAEGVVGISGPAGPELDLQSGLAPVA